MDHMYAAMAQTSGNKATPSTSARPPAYMLDHNFSRPPSESPDKGKTRSPSKSPRRGRKALARPKNSPGLSQRDGGGDRDANGDSAAMEEDAEDSDSKEAVFLPVATVASAPNSPQVMRSLLAEYLLSATAAHPMPGLVSDTSMEVDTVAADSTVDRCALSLQQTGSEHSKIDSGLFHSLQNHAVEPMESELTAVTQEANETKASSNGTESLVVNGEGLLKGPPFSAHCDDTSNRVAGNADVSSTVASSSSCTTAADMEPDTTNSENKSVSGDVDSQLDQASGSASSRSAECEGSEESHMPVNNTTGYSTIITPRSPEQTVSTTPSYMVVKRDGSGVAGEASEKESQIQKPGTATTVGVFTPSISSQRNGKVAVAATWRKRTVKQAGLDQSGDAQPFTSLKPTEVKSETASHTISTTADGSSIRIVNSTTPKPAKRVKKTSASSTSPAVKTPKNQQSLLSKVEVSMDISMFLIPLKEHGWKREVVLRGVFDENQGKSRPADTYYYAPDGKKLRSRVEIGKYLDEHPEMGLTVENFSFLKKSISEAPYETVRQAAGSSGRKPAKSANTSASKPAKVSKIHMKPVVGATSKATATASRSSSSPKPYNPLSRSSYVRYSEDDDDEDSELDDDEYNPWDDDGALDWHKRQKGKRTKRLSMHRHYPMEDEREILIQSIPEPDIVIDRAEDDNYDRIHYHDQDSKPPRMMLLPSDIKTETDSEGEIGGSVKIHRSPIKLAQRIKSTARKSTTPRMAQIKESRAAAEEDVVLCSNSCPGLDGVAPTMQCAVCMCLYHHQCVNVNPSIKVAFFKCMRCVDVPTLPNSSVQTPNIRPVSQPSLALPRLLPTSSRYLVIKPPAHPTVSILSTPSLAPRVFPLGAPYSAGHIPPSSSSSSGAMRPPLLIRGVATSKVGDTLLAPPAFSSTVRPPPRLIAAPGLSASSSVVSLSSPAAPLVSQAQPYQPQLMSLTPALLTRLDLSQPLAMKMNNTKVIVLPSCIIKSHDGVKVLLPANTFPVQPGNMGNFSVSISNVSTSALNLPSAVDPSTSMPSSALTITTNSIQGGLPSSQPHTLASGSTALMNVVKQYKESAEVKNKVLGDEGEMSQSKDSSETGDPSASAEEETLSNPGSEGEDARAERIIDETLSSMKIAMDEAQTLVQGSKKSLVADPASQNTADSSVSDSERRAKGRGGRSMRRRSVDFTKCSMHRLFGGFDCMLYIFQYLGIKDLLNARQVCRAWCQISQQKCLWQSIHLRGLAVTDWRLASNFFNSMGIQTLNCQDMVTSTESNKAWMRSWSPIANFSSNSNLRRLKFGLVPAIVLHILAEKLPELEYLQAEQITDVCDDSMWKTKSKLDIGKLSNKLSNLQELRLRGIGGLMPPTFTFDGSLAELSKLKNLHTLSLTSMCAQRAKEFKFLAEMKQLQVLELGDCPHWVAETYKLLGELTELKHLRLEYGGEIPDIGMGKALVKLQKLERLELILFTIPSTLSAWLSQLTALKTFVVWPDTSSHGIHPAVINSHALEAVSHMQQLKTLIWGVLDSARDSATSQPAPHEQATSTVPLLAREAPLRLEDTEWNESELRSPSLKEFTEQLCERLPNARVITTLKSTVNARLEV